MSDFNLFSSKTDIKKLLFTTEKFKFNDQCSNDSWQDLPGVTPTSVLASFVDNQDFQTSSLTSLIDNRNDNGWETLDDYSIIPKSYGLNCKNISKKPAGYCRLDRRGHWLLLPPPAPPPPLLQTNIKKVITYYDNKRISRDSNQQQNYQDSSESLTISIDLSSPIDFDETRQYQNITSDNMRRKSR